MNNFSNDTTKAVRAHLAPTALSQYVGLDNCNRYLRFYLHKGETDALLKRLAAGAEIDGKKRWLPVQPLSPLLAELGERVEADVVAALAAYGHVVQDLAELDFAGTIEAVQAVGDTPRYLYQVPMRGVLGRWPFEGRGDLVRIQRNPETGAFDALVIDIKASRKDKVQHRLQVAVYILMLQQMLSEAGIRAGRFEGAIIRRLPDGTLQDPVQVAPFDLAPYLSTVRFLTEGASSPLEQVHAAADFTKLHYYLGPRCDGCAFSPICLSETAERQDLSLIPFLESTDKRTLNAAGIYTLAELASLKQLVTSEVLDKPGKVKTRLKTSPGQEKLVAELSQRFPLAPRLDRLIQRAARARRQFDKTTTARSYFLDRLPRPMRSNLPDDKLYPDLIKIFLDVQLDYLEERVYLAGALIRGANNREKSVVCMTESVPTAESEQKMLLEWVAALFAAVGEVAGEVVTAPVHLYLYNRRDQKILLDALRRHLDAFAALPAFYRLLTDTPALTQPAIAFLYDEVRERMNLPGPLASLQVVARQLNFDWTNPDGQNFGRLFRAGLFDYGLRRNDGVYIHSAARFHSSIPLEYAYAAWGKIKPTRRVFREATRASITTFQAHRLRALAHIEAAFPFKNSYLQKEALPIAALQDAPDENNALAQVLEEFLHIEQYANLQQHLELFARPIRARVEQGRALLVRCTELETIEISRRRKQFLATFLAEFNKLSLHPLTALQVSKLKEGDFVSLSPLENDGQPWKIVSGRLARILEISGEWLKLELSGSTLNQGQTSAFRYFHARDLLPQPSQYYTIDPMVDNLNGDKLQEACRHADNNTLYKLAIASSPNNTSTSHNFERSTQSVASASSLMETNLANFATFIATLEGAERAPTADQLAVIVEHLDDPLFLVQGPPGTGKSHTIGWAVLARMYVNRLTTPNVPLRVLVSSQTHNAVEIVLESIVAKWRQVQSAGGEIAQALEKLRLFKAGGDEKAARSPEISFVDPWDKEQVKKALETAEENLLVIGATPGNLYNLMKEYYGRGKKKQMQVWEEKFFDLLMLDEASQMNMPHALLAAGWLKSQGQIIIVGDHRQLAPILVHGWEHEEHLPTVSSKPYRSVFQYFLDAGWPRIGLSESFRLHRAQAAFLQEQIYRHDNIKFHSRRQKRLAPLDATAPGVTDYVRAALHPDYPIVVIEHSEANSQQYNQVEVDLISPLIAAATEQLKLDGSDGIGIVVPHRAQKAVLRSRFPMLGRVGAIDTVERFQGGERDLIIVSTTASDPDYVAAEAEFLLSPNRAGVALSRPRCKLIVVTSRSVLQFVSARMELFEQAQLWKRLAAICADDLLWSGAPPAANSTESQPFEVHVYGHKA